MKKGNKILLPIATAALFVVYFVTWQLYYFHHVYVSLFAIAYYLIFFLAFIVAPLKILKTIYVMVFRRKTTYVLPGDKVCSLFALGIFGMLYILVFNTSETVATHGWRLFFNSLTYAFAGIICMSVAVGMLLTLKFVFDALFAVTKTKPHTVVETIEKSGLTHG